MKNRYRIFMHLGLLFIIFLSSGCAVNRATATIDPATNLDDIRYIHVSKLETDNRGVEVLIANKLKQSGYIVDLGDNIPPEADAVITYKDKWVWDITMYMLELTLTVRDPETSFPLASGNSYHTSLSRKDPEEMVDEVISNIFKQEKE